MRIIERIAGVLITGVLAAMVLTGVMLATFPRLAEADVDKDFDWKDKKRTLKVCVKSDGCPAGMVDSVKAAIGLWNAKLVSWKLEYEDSCSKADVKIACGKIKGLGLWKHVGPKSTYGASTKNEITINKDIDWGWCNDKYELVSTIVHELGHAMRLNDVAGQDKAMRGIQDTLGHLRGPTAADSIEAATSDSTGKSDADTNPTGGKRQQIYTGHISPSPGTDPFDLQLYPGTTVFVSTFRPEAVEVLDFAIVENDLVQWSALIGENAEGVEAFFLTIAFPGETVVRTGFLNVVDPWWDESWMPTAVAPSDTILPAPTSLVILDASASHHPAGPDGMIYRWKWDLDDEEHVLKGEPITSTTLPAGEHRILLEAIDRFGNVSTDEMMVIVEAATSEVIKDGNPRWYPNYQFPEHGSVGFGDTYYIYPGEVFEDWLLGLNFMPQGATECNKDDTFCFALADTAGWAIWYDPTGNFIIEEYWGGEVWYQVLSFRITCPCDAESGDENLMTFTLAYTDVSGNCRPDAEPCLDYGTTVTLAFEVVLGPPAFYVDADSLFLIQEGATAAYVPFSIVSGDPCYPPVDIDYLITSLGYVGDPISQGGTVTLSGGEFEAVYGVIDAGAALACDYDTLTITVTVTGDTVDVFTTVIHVIEPIAVPMFSSLVVTILVLATILVAAVILRRRAASRAW